MDALSRLQAADQASLGQFFTPARAASLIAGMPDLQPTDRLRVLDPGAGVGSLGAALVSRLLREHVTDRVELVTVELDRTITPYLVETLSDCHETAAKHGITLATSLITGDYIDLSVGLLSRDPKLAEPFDIVIMNPPYRKLAATSAHRKALASQGVDCPNLYAAFLALGTAALRSGGQLVAITPRSFANGSYFAPFRRFLLDRMALDRLHVFESRSAVFSDSGVLQENVVFSATRNGSRDSVVLSASVDHADEPVERVVDYDEVVLPKDPERFVRIALDEDDRVVAEIMARLPCSLIDLEIDVSTGKVVDFRSRGNLRAEPNEDCVPLVYPGNVRSGVVEWPRPIRKPQGFAANGDAAMKLLMPAGWYVVVKRFSSKEERRRVVSAVWDPGANGNTAVAFENHLNVFHRAGSGLERDMAVGLSMWLNSSAVDRFFRTFSGHTQVNAGDLRSLRFPSPTSLRALGEGQPALLPDQAKIDAMVDGVVAVRVPGSV